MKRLPIQAAKDVAKKYDQDQVILITWDKEEGLTHTVSYGKTESDCAQAAVGVNVIRETLKFPENMCFEVPMRARKRLPMVDYRIEFEGGEPMTCVRIPPGRTYGKKVYGEVVVVVVQARNLKEALRLAKVEAGVKAGPPLIGSKDWLWTYEEDGDEWSGTYTLDTDWGCYQILIEGGTATVTDDTDGMDLKIATFDLFRFGTYVDGEGAKLTPAQVQKGVAVVKRFCEMDARHKAQEDDA